MRCCGRDHCLGSSAWLEPRAACAAGATDCGTRRAVWLMSFGLLDLTRARLATERNEEVVEAHRLLECWACRPPAC
ncbi:hypothetical protein ACFX1S_008387 [Malus domestica]